MKYLALPVSTRRRTKWSAKPPQLRIGNRQVVDFTLDKPLDGDKSARYRGVYCLSFVGPNYGDYRVEMYPRKGKDILVSPEDASFFIDILTKVGILPVGVNFTTKEDKIARLIVPKSNDHRRSYAALCAARWIINRPALIWGFFEAFRLEKRLSVFQALCYAIARFESNLDKSFVGVLYPFQDLDSLRQPLMPLALEVFFAEKHPLKKYLPMGWEGSEWETNDLIHQLATNLNGVGGERYALEDPKDYLSPKLRPSLSLRSSREVRSFLKQNFTKEIGEDERHYGTWRSKDLRS